MKHSTKVSRQGQRARELWITLELTVPTLVLLAVVELAEVVGLVWGWVR